MTKITLGNLVNLTNQTSAVNTINNNNAVLTTAMDNTLSRDGTQPNQMLTALDMNSNRVVNLPSPISATEPVRLTDLATYATGGTVTFNAIPTGGTTGQTLTKNSNANFDAIWAGSNGTVVFDKRADVSGSIIPNTVTSITIKRFSATAPLEPATYTRGTISSTLAIQDAGGNYWGISGSEVYPEQFGALRDGSTNDASAFNQAFLYLHNNFTNAGTVRMRSGTYSLNTKGTGAMANAIVTLYNGISWIGVGKDTILKLGANIDNVNGFYFASTVTITAADHYDNATVSNFTIEGNGANNVSASYQPGFILGFTSNCVWNNLNIQNWAGSQPMAMGLNTGLGGVNVYTCFNASIINCFFSNNGPAVNPLNTDTSNIYIVGQDWVISGNHITSNGTEILSTGIELHGRGTCDNNTIDGCAKGFNIGAYPDAMVMCCNNYVFNVVCGMTLWETLGGANPTFIDRIIIANNIIEVRNNALQPHIDMANFGAGVLLSTVEIIGNYFESAESGTASINPVIAGGLFRNVQIIGNTAFNCAGPFFFCGTASANGASLNISDNTIIDCCTTSNATFKNAIMVNSAVAFQSIQICNNLIKNTSGGSPITTGILGNAPVGVTGVTKIVNNAFVNLTTNYNWTGTGRVEGIWLTYTPTLTPGTGAFTTTSSSGRFRIQGESMSVILTANITTVGTAAGSLSYSLPRTTIADGVVAGKEILVSGKSVAGFAASGGSTVSCFNYDNTTPLASGSKIMIFGELPV